MAGGRGRGTGEEVVVGERSESVGCVNVLPGLIWGEGVRGESGGGAQHQKECC